MPLTIPARLQHALLGDFTPLDELTPQSYLDLNAERYGLSERVNKLFLPRHGAPKIKEYHDEELSTTFLQDVYANGLGVAGAGLMGISIAAVAVNAGIPTLSYDVSDAALTSAPERLAREITAQRLRAGIACDVNAEEQQTVRRLVERFYQTTDSLEELARRRVVVESTPEKIKLKTKFYQKLNQAAKNPILLLTNTSSLRVDELAEALPEAQENQPLAKDFFCGFHFFHPVSKRSLLEIARGAKTSRNAVVCALALARAFKKTPILVNDAPGFLVNRVLQPYLNEALAMLEEGIEPDRVERVCLNFGMEGAPLRVVDEIGLDVTLHAGWSFLKAFPTRTHVSAILPEMARLNRLGRKTLLGFYRYQTHDSWSDDAELDCDAASLRALYRPDADAPTTNTASDDAELALRVFTCVLFEGARLLQEDVAANAQLVDLGLTRALGFPEKKGGAFYWALSAGLNDILRLAENFKSLGQRFDPPKLLIDLASV